MTTDARHRALRTAWQSLLALLAGGAFTMFWNELARGYQIPFWLAALVTILVGPFLVSWAQNELEDTGVIKTRLKDPATPAAARKTDA